jgi:hypothetical protein
MALEGWLRFHDMIPRQLEDWLPWLDTHPLASFLIYLLILDFAEYWRHRLSHTFRWWWALHGIHHSQRQMSFWTDSRNHLLDDLIAGMWFACLSLLIGVPPGHFIGLLVTLRLVENLSHTNTRLSFGRFGDYLIVGPRYHRWHHATRSAEASAIATAAISRSCCPLGCLFGTLPRKGAPADRHPRRQYRLQLLPGTISGATEAGAHPVVAGAGDPRSGKVAFEREAHTGQAGSRPRRIVRQSMVSASSRSRRPVSVSPQPDQQLERLGRLNGADDARDRRKHAHHCAAHLLHILALGKQAVVARAVLMRRRSKTDT